MKTDDPDPSSDSNLERKINVLGQAGVMVKYSKSLLEYAFHISSNFLFITVCWHLYYL